MVPSPEVPGRAARLTALGTAAGICGLVALRVVRDGIQPYGSDGAEYIEHAARLAVRQHVLSGGALNPWRILTTSDANFPPLLHLLSLPFESAEAAAATGIVWMLLLAAAVGVTAAKIAGRTEVGAAAATGTLLVPAVHGMAARYYYDLPMIALLWMSAAVLVTWVDKRPVQAGIGAGMLLWAAAITKWAALPFGPPMLLGAVALGVRRGEDGREGRRNRVVAGLVCTAVCATLCMGFLAGRSGENSFAKMGRVAFAEGSPSRWDGSEEPPGAVQSLVVSVGARVGRLRVADLAFYPVVTATSIFSPAGFLVLVALAFLWVRSGAPGAVLPGVTIAGHALFLLCVMPVLDDRFAAVAAPALVIAAALGWAGLPEPRRRSVGIGVVVLGSVLALDFHVGPTAVWNTQVPILVIDRDDFPPTYARGLGSSSSTEHRGWARSDAQRDRQPELRTKLWQAVEGCDATGLGLLAERPLVTPDGDIEWARYESLRAGGPRVGVICGPQARWEHDVELDLVAVGSPGSGLPGCLDRSGWRRASVVQVEDGGPRVELWARGRACPP